MSPPVFVDQVHPYVLTWLSYNTSIDGRNRYEICTRRGIPFATVAAEDVYSRDDAIRWIGANQLGRRNLDASRKAAFALELEKQLAVEAKKRLRLNNESKARLPYSEKGQARDLAAQLTGAGARYITDAKKIQATAKGKTSFLSVQYDTLRIVII